MEQNYYEILGVSRDASVEEIRKQSRKVRAKYHPDINKDPEAEKIYKYANEALKTLTDANERAAYDQALAAEERRRNSFTTSNLFNTRTDLKSPQQGEDIRKRVVVKMSEIINSNLTKVVTVQQKEKCKPCNGEGKIHSSEGVCPSCNGTKKVQNETVNPLGVKTVTTQICLDCYGKEDTSTTCTECNGEGYIIHNVDVDVVIPKGITHNTKVYVDGYGQPGINGGPAGRLEVRVLVEADMDYRQEGLNLIFDVPVTYAQLMLGDTIEVPIPGGTQEVTINPFTKPYEDIVLKGKGMMDYGTREKGDLVFHLDLQIPAALTDMQKEMLRTLNI